MQHFPAYAPELNPIERVWRHGKAPLANGRPRDIRKFAQGLLASLYGTGHSQRNFTFVLDRAAPTVRLW